MSAYPEISLCIGASKCGTTWLDNILRQYCPDRLPVGEKETFFFDRHYARGIQWYKGCYKITCSNPVEVAPSYMSSSQVVSRVSAHYCRRRLLVMVRDPYQRAASDLIHNINRGEVSLRSGKLKVSATAMKNIDTNSRYRSHFESWLQSDPHFLAVSQFPVADPSWFASVVSQFIGLETGTVSAQFISSMLGQRIYEGKIYRYEMLAKVARLLRPMVGSSIRQLTSKVLRSMLTSAAADAREAAAEFVTRSFDFELDKEWIKNEVGPVGRVFVDSQDA